MSESATLNRRERRKQETASQLTAVCRRLTAERGLAGFTLEEVCNEVDVSRRTFFNYFATKEDAVIGADPEEESRKFAEDFFALGSRGWEAVVDDLVALVINHFETADIDTVGHGEFMQALEREPKLWARFVGTTRERERQAAALIAQREGVDPDDPRAAAAILVLTTLLRTTGDRLLRPGNTREFSAIMTESLSALRVVLATSPSRKETL
jgi:AcrR family transcriptional regulator